MSLSPSFEAAAALVEGFGVGTQLTARISALEEAVRNRPRSEIEQLLRDERCEDELVVGARVVKRMVGQINVLIHAAGILCSLPYVLEPDEVVLSVSLGAGNTGRAHDLETDRQIAEFKMIDWRGGSESIRQNNVFADVFGLASAATKRRVLYLIGTEHALEFLNGGRGITSVLSRNSKLRRLFYERYGEDRFRTVRSYWRTVKDVVELVDLSDVVPAFQMSE